MADTAAPETLTEPQTTSTSEVLRERQAAPMPPPPPQGEPGSPAWLNSQITGTFGNLQQARKREQQGLVEQAAAVEPSINAAKQAMADIEMGQPARLALVDSARDQWKAIQKQQPSRQLSAFLTPREGESAEASVTKMASALMLFAGGIGGLAAGNASSALAGFKGALEGWQEGDRLRGDRAFADWKEKSQAALDDWEMERDSYNRWVKDGTLTIENALAGLKLEAYRAGNKQAIRAFETGSLKEALNELEQMQQHADNFANQRLRILEMGETHAENQRHNRTMEEFKARELALKSKEQEQSLYDPQTLRDLAMQYRNGAPLNELVRGFGKSASKSAAEIQRIAAEMDRQEGVDPADTMVRRRTMQANTAALKKLQTQETEFRSFLTTFDKTVDNARKLSLEYERSGVPLWNAVKLKADIQRGSVAAKNWDVQMDILAQELARVTTRQRNTTVEARMHAREQLNASQTREQFESLITNVLKVDAANALAGFQQEKAILESAMRPQASGAGEEITIIRDKDGKLVRQ